MRVMVPLVCKENWEELIKCSQDDATLVIRLEVKKLTPIKSNPWGVLVCLYYDVSAILFEDLSSWLMNGKNV